MLIPAGHFIRAACADVLCRFTETADVVPADITIVQISAEETE